MRYPTQGSGVFRPRVGAVASASRKTDVRGPRRLRFSPRRRQIGAAGIEFALLFTLFFAVFYAIVGYALAMMLLQGFTQAAEEGARAAIKQDPLTYPTTAAYQTAVTATATTAAKNALAWLPAGAQSTVFSGNNVSATFDPSGTVITVVVAYPNYVGNPLIPILVLPGIGSVPALPRDLRGTASLQL